ncbi:hypothetical protein Q1695_002094 [Nippostrongylus brasiliensis]|nr:hypothetical protein Q1695_002094 [Nippostrongylus brasiliensis]
MVDKASKISQNKKDAITGDITPLINPMGFAGRLVAFSFIHATAMRGLNLCSSAILIGLIVLSKLDDTNAGSGGLSNKTSLNLVHNAFDGFHLGIYTHLESSTLFFNNSNTFYDPEHELTHNRRKRTTPRRHATPPTVKKPTPKVTRATDPPPPSVARTPDPPPPPVPQAPEPPSAPPALSDAPVKPTSKFMVVPDDHSTTPGEQQFRTRKQHTKVKTTNTGAIFFLIFCSITCLSFGVLAGLLIYMLILVRHRGGKLSSKGTSKSASS